MDVNLAESDLLHREAESRMQMVRGFPEAFALVLRTQDAALLIKGKSLALARV